MVVTVTAQCVLYASCAVLGFPLFEVPRPSNTLSLNFSGHVGVHVPVSDRATACVLPRDCCAFLSGAFCVRRHQSRAYAYTILLRRRSHARCLLSLQSVRTCTPCMLCAQHGRIDTMLSYCLLCRFRSSRIPTCSLFGHAFGHIADPC